MSRSFWTYPILRLSALALISAITGAFFGAVFGLSVAIIGLVVFFIVQLRYLAKLKQWLKTPELEQIPEGWGAWSDVFAQLYRAYRRDQKSRERLTAALDRFTRGASALPDGIVLLNEANQIQWANATAERHFAISAKSDRGSLITNLVRQPEFVQYLAAGDFEQTLVMRPADPMFRTFSLQLIPFSDTSKLLVSRDITQIERAEIIRRDFIANISHELRTPMTVIHGFLEHLVNDESRQKEGASKFAQVMFEQSQRILRLIEDLLTLSRLEAHDNLLREEEIAMPQFVEDLVAEAKTLSQNRHHIGYSCSNAGLRGNRDELRSAFSNLITNAIRYTPEAGHVQVDWQIENNSGIFSVTDTGIGIAPDHIPRLTERFYRVDRGRSRETGGTGLGLAIVKHVLMRHQATLEVQSNIGEGSVFTAVFPAERIMPAVDTPAEAQTI